MSALETATFGGGCFWCTEAVMQRLKGVERVTSGYAGGTAENPSYDDLHGKDTGHVEAVQVEFDPAMIPYERLLDVFFTSHDPTQTDGQGNDIGKEYQSKIFTHTDAQHSTAEHYRDKLEQSGTYAKPIITEIVRFTTFSPAEPEHQNYYNNNQNNPYCEVVIDPKLAKLRKKFAPYLKTRS